MYGQMFEGIVYSWSNYLFNNYSFRDLVYSPCQGNFFFPLIKKENAVSSD